MKTKIGVMFGGRSVEHEVSIISGIQALNNIDKEKYDAIPIYITRENEMYVGDLIGKVESYTNLKNLIANSQRVILINNGNKVDLVKYPYKMFEKHIYDTIDIAFPVVHGTNVEDGTLQGYLKTLNIPFVGCDVTASCVGMDKYVMKTVLKENDIPVLDCIRINDYEYIEDNEDTIYKIMNKLDFPVITKPVNLGSSVGIKIAKNKNELVEAVEYAFQFSKQILVEKAITNLKEINCSVLGDVSDCKPSECEEPITSGEILSYEDKYISGKTKKTGGSKGMTSLDRKLPADIDESTKNEIQKLAVETFKVLNCNGVVRIDFMIDMDTNKIYVNEINTIPGSLAFYLWEATGIKYKELIDILINLALKRNREQNNLSFSYDTKILEGYKGGLKGIKK